MPLLCNDDGDNLPDTFARSSKLFHPRSRLELIVPWTSLMLASLVWRTIWRSPSLIATIVLSLTGA
jgi:hypothetical protein